jgi:hypothetical protein
MCWLFCWFSCWLLYCCHVVVIVFVVAAAAIGALLPPLPLVGVEDDACYTNADSNPAKSAHAICGA